MALWSMAPIRVLLSRGSKGFVHVHCLAFLWFFLFYVTSSIANPFISRKILHKSYIKSKTNQVPHDSSLYPLFILLSEEAAVTSDKVGWGVVGFFSEMPLHVCGYRVWWYFLGTLFPTMVDIEQTVMGQAGAQPSWKAARGYLPAPGYY